ncbi:ABC transporter permease [Agromyces sp. NPDC058136]|uniref:ABC transporter permease n=1 Tax=Agromyces sp. NPDC058136 TaxID=3346354 RepID=UPI0036D7F7FC
MSTATATPKGVPAPARAPRRNHFLADAVTMTRRNLLHMIRYPALTIQTVAMPVVFLLLFVFVFGGTLGAGLPGVGADAGIPEYLVYVVPGILLITIAAAAPSTAITVAMDMTEGIIARFRTMAISRAAVLTGHVLGNLLQTLLAVALVFGVALALGFRATTGPAEWALAAGVIVLIAFSITWLGVAFGTAAKTVESASNAPLLLVLLPLLGSGFVPTDSMPAGVEWFAEHQPFTPFMETVRSLLTGTPMGDNGWLTLAWCAVLTLIGYVWSLRLYNRKSVK